MITEERLEDICRFHDLVRTVMAESTEPLTMLQRSVLQDMMAELIDHARATTQE